MAKKESAFQSDLVKELKNRFDGCVVLKNDPSHRQGIPDLTVLYRDRWATLECKRSENEHRQPNQDWWVEKMNGMSFSRFIFPENRDEVLAELEDWFQWQDVDWD